MYKKYFCTLIASYTFAPSPINKEQTLFTPAQLSLDREPLLTPTLLMQTNSATESVDEKLIKAPIKSTSALININYFIKNFDSATYGGFLAAENIPQFKQLGAGMECLEPILFYIINRLDALKTTCDVEKLSKELLLNYQSCIANELQTLQRQKRHLQEFFDAVKKLRHVIKHQITLTNATTERRQITIRLLKNAAEIVLSSDLQFSVQLRPFLAFLYYAKYAEDKTITMTDFFNNPLDTRWYSQSREFWHIIRGSQAWDDRTGGFKFAFYFGLAIGAPVAPVALPIVFTIFKYQDYEKDKKCLREGGIARPTLTNAECQCEFTF